MGTRAAFFIGDPRDVENREWLGCIAFDGYPHGDCNVLADATSEQHFRNLVDEIAMERYDFADPAKGGFPFPWTDDLFLTDCVYAFFNDTTHVDYNRNWRTIRWVLDTPVDEQDAWCESNPCDPSFENVPAPGGKWDRRQPDSIMIFSAKK